MGQRGSVPSLFQASALRVALSGQELGRLCGFVDMRASPPLPGVVPNISVFHVCVCVCVWGERERR